MYVLVKAKWYIKTLKRLGAGDLIRLGVLEKVLKEKPHQGRPLEIPFFREKRLDGKRLLFLVYEQKNSVFLLTITDKKAQQSDIDYIKKHLQRFKSIVEELLKNY